ncbi:hypothetical protein FNV43_RR20139 [Rhamnella rubrinervis]|uniref:Uncharacterized protein n=1 Tax=Rhamnella rubrinervis TaxID=2594499 RepID=A0A8K0DZ53_9ROSA|nr:hypothetical protein FNV43_RR20139 [Rhamnella rubrinervis]
MNSTVLEAKLCTPLLSASTTSASSGSSTSSETDDTPPTSSRFELQDCITGKDIIVWQQPDLRLFTKFGQGDGSVKALVSVGNKVFTAHQDSRIRVWKVSRRSENVFRLVDTLPTTKDYLGIYNGFIYSGSWDKTLKVWRISDLKCLESIKAHDDAINGLVACKGIVYSASADGKIKAWGKEGKVSHSLKGILEGHKDVSLNSVIVSEDGKWVLEVDQMVGEFLCSGSADKSIGLWKREPFGKLHKVGVISGHEGPVKCLQASPSNVGSGFLLYSGSLDKSLRVWWVPKHSSKEEEDSSITDASDSKSII